MMIPAIDIPGSSIHRIFQARVLEWVAIAFFIKRAECWQIDAFELWCWRRLLRVPLDCKEIQPIHPQGNQSWIFIGRTDAEAETPILWPPDVKSRLTGKDPDAGKDGRQEEEGDDRWWNGWMASPTQWHHWLNGHEFEQTPGDPGGAWYAAVHGVSKSWTQLNDWTTTMTSYSINKSRNIFINKEGLEWTPV